MCAQIQQETAMHSRDCCFKGHERISLIIKLLPCNNGNAATVHNSWWPSGSGVRPVVRRLWV